MSLPYTTTVLSSSPAVSKAAIHIHSAQAALGLLISEGAEVVFQQGFRLVRELSALARKQVWFTLGIGAIGFGGMFAVFSYVKPTMLEVAHMPVSGIPIVLALFGVGMVTGNLAGARLADKALMPTVGGVLVWSALVLGAFVFTAPYPWLASLNVMLVGTAVALGPPGVVALLGREQGLGPAALQPGAQARDLLRHRAAQARRMGAGPGGRRRPVHRRRAAGRHFRQRPGQCLRGHLCRHFSDKHHRQRDRHLGDAFPDRSRHDARRNQ